MAKKVRRVCMECAILAGKKENQLGSKARFYKSSCDFCEQTRAVCDANWWRYFTPLQIKQGRDAVKRLGIHKSQLALPDDVQRLIDVVRGVLGNQYMSLETKTIVEDMEIRLARAEPIQMYDTKLLSTWYAADCVQMKNAKKAQADVSRIIYPSSELVVIESGQQRGIPLGAESSVTS